MDNRNRAILTFLHTFALKHGQSPTIREICAGTGISSSGIVARRVEILTKLGFIKKSSARERNLQVTERGLGFVESKIVEP